MISQPTNNRNSHATLKLASRNAKARKIELLLNLADTRKPFRMLEVGTGSGGIAHYFGSHPALICEVEAVDVFDNRQVFDNYRFTLVRSTRLPFPDNDFDVVLSNHVIEHVGDEFAQCQHLSELWRVLKPNGRGYLAVPNRWQWVEPHYRIAGLSWLPEGWRSPYLRWRGRGDHYDCRPLSSASIEDMLQDANFSFEQQHSAALRLAYELENPNSPAYRFLFRHISEATYSAVRRALPTLIYLLWSEKSG